MAAWSTVGYSQTRYTCCLLLAAPTLTSHTPSPHSDMLAKKLPLLLGLMDTVGDASSGGGISNALAVVLGQYMER